MFWSPVVMKNILDLSKIQGRQLFDPLLFQASDCYRGQQWAAPGGNGSFSGISSGTVNIWWRLFFPDSSISIIITGTFCVVHCCSVFRLNCADPIVNTVPVPVKSRGFPSILKRYTMYFRCTPKKVSSQINYGI